MDLSRSKLLLGLLLLCGCGMYSFRGNLPAHINSIAVAGIINQTAEFTVTDLMREEVTDLFVTENIIRVTDEGLSDSNLQITVKRVSDQPLTYTVGESVQEWRVNITTQVVWHDLIKNRPLFDKSFSGFGDYPAGGDIGSDNIDNDNDGDIDEEDEFGDPREFAIRTALRKITEDILNEVVATW